MTQKPTAPPPPKRRLFRLRWHIILLNMLAILLAIVALRAVYAVCLARQLKTLAGTMQAEVPALPESPDTTASIQQLRGDLAQARRLTANLRGAIWPFGGLLRSLGWVPLYGDDLAAVPYILDTAESLLNAASALEQGFSPLIEPVLSGGTEAQGRLALAAETAANAAPLLEQAAHDLEAARRARARIPDSSALIPPLREAVDGIDQVIGLLDVGLSGLKTLPVLLGTESPHHILILLQNADELRPTGGFITASAYIVIEQGRIVQMEVRPSNSDQTDHFYQIAYEQPPQPLYEYMHLPLWAFRDANWSPDFPTSAAKAAWLYQQGQDVPIDTVIAITQYTIRDFIAATGPLTLEDGTIIHADNILDYFRELWFQYAAERGYTSRKDFIAELAPLILQNVLQAGDSARMAALLQTALNAGERGDLLIYSTDPTVQAMVERMGWDGSIPDWQGDSLYVVDTNISYNKANLNVQRRMTYEIDLTGLSAPSATLRLVYQNFGTRPQCRWPLDPIASYMDLADDCYGDYLRVYVPQGVEMHEMPVFGLPPTYPWVDDPAAGVFRALEDERGRQVYGGLMVLPPGATFGAEFVYTLPPTVLVQRADGALIYDLLIQKQPGLPDHPITVRVTLPPGSALLEATPAVGAQDGRTLYFEGTLSADWHIRVVMSAPEGEGIPSIPTLAPASEAAPTPRLVPTQPPLPTLPPGATIQPAP